MILACLARAPVSAIERVASEWRIARSAPMPPPIFIVGHWRSGTTHLYNVMSRDPALGFVPPLATGLPWDLFGLARLFRPLLERALPEHRWIDPIPVTPDAPQEDEIALANMTTLSFYHGLYFPKRLEEQFDRGVFFDGCTEGEIESWARRHRHFLLKLYLHQGRRRLLVKNPVYTARVRLLSQIWSGAKFIHVHRDPVPVFASMRNFYRRLLEAFALQKASGVSDDFILTRFARLLERLEEDRRDLPENAFVEVALADFERQPLDCLERIYARLGLDGFAAARPHFEAALVRERSYPKRSWTLSDDEIRRVEARLGPLVGHYGGALPPRNAAAATTSERACDD